MKHLSVLALCFVSRLVYAQPEVKLEVQGYLESSNPHVEIEKTRQTVLGIDIYGTDSKRVMHKQQLVRDWDEFVPKQVEVVIHKQEFDEKKFSDATGYFQRDIVHLNYVYYIEEERLVPAIHLQVYKGHLNTTFVLEQDSYRILLSREEIDFCGPPLDARDLLQRKNIPSVQFQYWDDDSPAPGNPHPTGIPDQWQAPTVEPVFISNRSSTASPLGWIRDQFPYQTKGNNAFGVTFGVNNNLFADGFVSAENGIFAPLYSFDTRSNQSNTLQASLVNMFVHANLLHDWYWNYGFQEEDGNFQKHNFGRGGIEGDAMTIAAWYSPILINNAYYSGTHIDGTPGTINMLHFLYDEVNGNDRHSGFDSQIFSHEYQHGVTRRLVGEISLRTARGLNEGWSDIAALIYTTEEVPDMKTSTFSMGGWTLYQFLGNENYHNNYYYGGRVLPVTYDMERNPITLADIDSSQFSIEDGIPWNENNYFPQSAHFVGQVWVAALWDVYTLLNEVYPYDEARSIMTAIMIEGLKLTPPEPSFLEARDAFVLADEFVSSSEHRVAIWNAFARRGIGTEAVAPWYLADVIEDFSEPNWADFNQDGILNITDIEAFMDSYNANERKADLNWDGIIDKLDISLFVDLY